MPSRGAFSHGLVRYKDHFVIDLEVPLAIGLSPPPAERTQGSRG